ncbi:DNA mismatch repair protein MutS [Putridiphycobacter roseus]|uniref:DNA mismatch repair protein MutS n=1 Tax=Putridiphycobacter roseus TaxID=2219161 RepID=A0A2W1MW17_9FLAO|nr:DNA mismatch repair protein MutS [Putridiphycobacter roseus]PZE16027.1 DNA mismatch repair protein MutS [Putridiphycobacter roseus]
MNNLPLEFYNEKLLQYEVDLKKNKKQLLVFALLRLLIFLVTGLGIYLTLSIKLLPIAIAVIGFAVFLRLIVKHAALKKENGFLKNLVFINTKEIDYLTKGDLAYANGEELIDGNHFYAADIDVFGPGSIFNIINRTHSLEGKKKLANLLTANEIDGIEEKQEMIKELANKADWRQKFQAKINTMEAAISQKVVMDWLKAYEAIVHPSFKKIKYLFQGLTLVFLIGYIFDFINYLPLLLLFFVGLFISGKYVGKINKFNVHLSELKQVFSSYADPIASVEAEEFRAKLNQEVQANVKKEGESASQLIHEFSKYLSALDQRNNILFAVLGNGFLLWDISQVNKIDTWLKNHVQDIEGWFNAITYFEANNSLGNFSYNHPTYTFPKINKQSNDVIQAKQLGHLMIDAKKRVNNDFKIGTNEFDIITGANMAGKSTFLRTVALSIVSANVGLPVCATSFEYNPIRLITSMRNNDSLQSDSSYFYAELVRLKTIIDAIAEKPYFIILDEILKGTNSKDKEQGSIQLMHKLSKSNSAGIIATHDLGLCEIEKELDNITNLYFDAEIENDELYFDYTLKSGICQNMNASFLLKKMAII